MDAHERGFVASSAAQVYEEFFVPALFGPWPPVLLDRASAGAGDRVLDVGTGTGVLARAAADRVGDEGHVVGLDVNAGMLDVARALDDRVEWVEGDIASLPMPDSTFDGVVSQFVLMFVPDVAAALAEMRRVLRPGGRVAVATWAALDHTPGYTAMHGVLHDVLGPDAARSLTVPYSMGEPSAVADLLATAFDDVSVDEVPGTARFASVEEWVHTDIRGWTLAGSIDDDQHAAVLEEAERRLVGFVGPDGSVAFDHPAVVASGAA